MLDLEERGGARRGGRHPLPGLHRLEMGNQL